MSTYDEQRATDLAALAKRWLLRNLTQAEEVVIEQSASSHDFIGPVNEIRTATIDAQFLRWLATNVEAAVHLDPKGVRLRSTVIVGDLDFNNCTLSTSLIAHSCDVNGEFRLAYTTAKNIEFLGCRFFGPIGGRSTVVHGSFEICNSIAHKEISLNQIEVVGDVSLAGLDVQNTAAHISMDGARVTGSVLLIDGFKTKASVQMHNARIGDLNCCGGILSDSSALLSLDGITVNGDLSLSQGFTCLGTIRLPGAHIFGNLECIEATIGTFIGHNMKVDGDLMWVDIKYAPQHRFSLVGVTVKSFRDQKSSWPSRGNLDLEGFVYEHLTVHEDSAFAPAPRGELPPRKPFNAQERIDWINLQCSDRIGESQPWMQLVKTAQALGDDRGAHHVVYQFARRRAEQSVIPVRWGRIAFAWLREQPFRIAWSIFLILFFATAVFWWAGSNGAVGPREKDAYNAWAKGQPFPEAYPKFNPLIYSLENELPLVKMGQDDKWAPDPSHRAVSFGAGYLLHWTWIFNSYGVLTWVRWLSVILGWIQATVLAAALGNRFKS